jgi:hypothetical protein
VGGWPCSSKNRLVSIPLTKAGSALRQDYEQSNVKEQARLKGRPLMQPCLDWYYAYEGEDGERYIVGFRDAQM